MFYRYRPRASAVSESCNSMESKFNSSTDDHIYEYIATRENDESSKTKCASASVHEYRNVQPSYSTLDRTIPGHLSGCHELSTPQELSTNPFSPYSSLQEHNSTNPFNPYSSPPSRQCMSQPQNPLLESTEYVEMKGVKLT